MGMFDWYRPAGDFECPLCHVALREWQGKDGPNFLCVWQQGCGAMFDQDVPEECRFAPEFVASERLPERFTIYSYDCDRHRVAATCRTIDGVWVETFIDSVFDLETRREALTKSR